MPKKKLKKVSKSVDYNEDLLESLKDHDEAVAYLNAAIEESLKGDPESQKLFLKALRNVAQAQGNFSDLARRANLRRENVYKMLSEKGNPELKSLGALLHAMGLQLRVH